MDTAPVINQSDPELEKERRFKLKKYCMISLAVVVVVACLVGGMVGGMHYLHTSTKDMSKMVTAYKQTFKDKDGKTAKEKIKYDLKNNVTETTSKNMSKMVTAYNLTFKGRDGKTAKEKIKYDLKNNVTETTVKKNDSEIKILNDFKRGISVTRTSSKDGAVCYVSTLSKDAKEMHPETLEQYKKQHPNPDVIDDERPANETENRSFQVADNPMPDTAFLGKKVQEMCKGLKTYWLYPSDEMPPAGMDGTMGGEGDEEAEADGTVGKRQARALDTCYQCPFIITISGSWWIRYGCKKYRCVTICYYQRFLCYWRFVCVHGRCKVIWRCTYFRKSTQKRSRC